MENFEGHPQIIPQQETPKAEILDIKITPEQKELLESATKFAEYLTGRWPQVDTSRKLIIEIDDKGTTVELPELPENVKIEPIINYYLSGSLATMLLSRAEKFSEMDETLIPALVESGTREIPKPARKILASFARQIGDLDYVPSDHYKNNPSKLKKGGGGPSFNEIPEEGRKVLKQEENQVKVMCDPVEAYGTKKIAKVNVEGQDYYIARPDTIFAYKVLHLLQSYDQKPEKFNVDFDKLHGALKEIYSEEELRQITKQVLTDYEKTMEELHISFNQNKENPPVYEKKIPKFIDRVLTNQKVSPEIRTTLEKLRE